MSLPDRDYYFRDDAPTKAIREAFTLHVAKMMQLLGATSEAAAVRDARTVFDFESTLAQSYLTRVQARDPYQRFHKMDLAKLKELAPAFDWDAAFRLLGIPATVVVDVRQPEVEKGPQSATGIRASRHLENMAAVAGGEQSRAIPVEDVLRRMVSLQQHRFIGGSAAAAPMENLRG